MTGRVVPIWTRQDAVDTAQQFHLELDNSERGHRVCRICDRSHLIVRIAEDGVCRNCRKRQSRNAFGNRLLFSQSRHRKARAMDAFAVACLMLVLAALGCAVLILATPKAKADDVEPAVVAYAALYGGIVCDVLDQHPTVSGVAGVADGITEESGFTQFQAGEVIGLAVTDTCPRHLGLIRRFIATNTGIPA